MPEDRENLKLPVVRAFLNVFKNLNKDLKKKVM